MGLCRCSAAAEKVHPKERKEDRSRRGPRRCGREGGGTISYTAVRTFVCTPQRSSGAGTGVGLEVGEGGLLRRAQASG